MIWKLSPQEFETSFLEVESHDPKSAAIGHYVRCADDLDLFARYYFPHYCGHPFNQFHRDYFEDVGFGERNVRRSRGAPRGYAKSTLTALIKAIHDLCYGLEDFIIVISNTQPQANGKLKDIRRELLTNDKLIAAYGIKFVGNKAAETSFVVECNRHQTMLAAYGAGAEIRGIRFGEHRPSKIICDDVEHSEEVYNEEIRQKYENWFFEVISQVGNEHTNIEFIGTVLHRESLLSKLLKNPAYQARLYRAVINWADDEKLWDLWRQIYTNLEDDTRAAKADLFFAENKEAMLKGTKVLWPEKEPYDYLMKELVEKGKRAFMKEKQNQPTGVADKIFEELHWYRETNVGLQIEKTGVVIPWSEIQEWSFGVIDPATGQTKAKKGKLGDYTCILTGYKDHKGRLLVHSAYMKRAAPSAYISEIFEHHEKFKYNKFGVETNLYRNLLLPNILEERKRRGKELKKIIKLPFYDIDNVDNKEKRIFTLEPKVSHGWILFNRTLPQEFISQIEDFPHADHDDGPDSLEMLWGLVNNRYKASAMSLDVMSQ